MSVERCGMSVPGIEPDEECRACSGEVCLLCGANPAADGIKCEHDSFERHIDGLKLPRDGEGA